MKRTLKSLVCFGLLIILEISCKSTSIKAPIPSITPESRPNWWTLWLAEPVCKLPCWQNITPGVTTMKEAVSILESSSEIEIKYQSEDGLDWTFSQNKDEGGTLTASPDGMVETVWIESNANEKLLLKKIVTSYSYPKYVKPYDCREGMCATVLLYPQLGMFLDVFIDNKGITHDPRIDILPETVVRRVYFIKQGLENFDKIPDFQDYDLLIEWKGYGEYP